MWIVCQLKTDRTQPKSDKTGQHPIIAEPMPTLGQHNTRTDALRALVTLYYPEHAHATKEHLKRVAKDLLSGTTKIHRIESVKWRAKATQVF